jgi:hypothetical protein
MALPSRPLKASKPFNEIGITVICCQCWPSTRIVAQDGSDLRGDRTAAERIGDQIRQVVVARAWQSSSPRRRMAELQSVGLGIVESTFDPDGEGYMVVAGSA